MKIIAHTENGLLAELDKDEFGAIALRETYTSLKNRHGIGPDDYTSRLPEDAMALTGDMALKAGTDTWRPPAGTEFFLRFDLSDVIGNLRHNLAQLEKVHILTRGQKPEPEQVHPVDAIVAMFGNEQVHRAFQDVVKFHKGTLQLVLTRPPGEPLPDRLDTQVQHIPYLNSPPDTAVVDAEFPTDERIASLGPARIVTRREVNQRLRLKHPLKGLKNNDPDLYRAVKSALAKRSAASRRKPSHP